MKLIKPDSQYLESYLAAIKENEPFLKNETANDVGGFFLPKDADLFQTMENYHLGINLPTGYVPATYLWLVDGNEFIGMINIRHCLTDFLLYYGGHIGYTIRHSKWNQNYGTKMLALGLEYCQKVLNLSNVLITCKDNNNASRRVIEKNNGVLWDIREVTVIGQTFPLRRYCINVALYRDSYD